MLTGNVMTPERTTSLLDARAGAAVVDGLGLDWAGLVACGRGRGRGRGRGSGRESLKRVEVSVRVCECVVAALEQADEVAGLHSRDGGRTGCVGFGHRQGPSGGVEGSRRKGSSRSWSTEGERVSRSE